MFLCYNKPSYYCNSKNHNTLTTIKRDKLQYKSDILYRVSEFRFSTYDPHKRQEIQKWLNGTKVVDHSVSMHV